MDISSGCIRLLKPDISHKDEYLDMVNEWKQSGEKFVPCVLNEDTTDFAAMISRFENYSLGIGIKEGFVPCSTYWLVRDPFELGNGRVGRILAMLIMMQNKIISKPVISLSYYLFYNKIEYFDRLSSTQGNGNYAQWVKFFIGSIIVAADNSIKQIESSIALRKKNIEKIKTLGKLSRNTMLVYGYMEKHPVIRIPSAAGELNLSFNTVAKAIDAM